MIHHNRRQFAQVLQSSAGWIWTHQETAAIAIRSHAAVWQVEAENDENRVAPALLPVLASSRME